MPINCGPVIANQSTISPSDRSSPPAPSKTRIPLWDSTDFAHSAPSRKSRSSPSEASRVKPHYRSSKPAPTPSRSSATCIPNPAPKPRCARVRKNGWLFVRRVGHRKRSLAAFNAYNYGHVMLVGLILRRQHPSRGLAILIRDIAGGCHPRSLELILVIFDNLIARVAGLESECTAGAILALR